MVTLYPRDMAWLPRSGASVPPSSHQKRVVCFRPQPRHIPWVQGVHPHLQVVGVDGHLVPTGYGVAAEERRERAPFFTSEESRVLPTSDTPYPVGTRCPSTPAGCRCGWSPCTHGIWRGCRGAPRACPLL